MNISGLTNKLKDMFKQEEDFNTLLSKASLESVDGLIDAYNEKDYGEKEYGELKNFLNKYPAVKNCRNYRKYLIIKNKNYEEYRKLEKERIIVSFTSYGTRINCVPLVVRDILNQTLKADEVVLWLSNLQFNSEDDLPDTVKELIKENKLTVRFVDDDIRSHKKYYYAFREYPDDIIITIDDDLRYRKDMIEKLYMGYLDNPETIPSMRGHLITFDEDKNVLPYECWIKEIRHCMNKPSFQIFGTTGAGTLFPPHLLKTDFFDTKVIKEKCLNADDLWLKAVELISDVPVMIVYYYYALEYIEGSQEESLAQINVTGNGNNEAMGNIEEYFDDHFSKGILKEKLLSKCEYKNAINLTGQKDVMDLVNRTYSTTKAELNKARNTRG